MSDKTIRVKRSSVVLRGDPGFVLARPFHPMGAERVQKICSRILALPDSEVASLLGQVLAEFGERHRNIRESFRRNYRTLHVRPVTEAKMSEERELLLGAFFTHEYSLEAAALFNPSIVPHPDQSGIAAGSTRFILSLRATGEGHISSITFRTGVVDAGNQIAIDPPGRYRIEPEIVNSEGRTVEPPGSVAEHAPGEVQAMAGSNYEVRFDAGSKLPERVLFPMTRAQSNGIEDARFVRFDDGAERTYYATYTAYDGRRIEPQLLQTSDFLHFKFGTLKGPAARNKGMALFPRKIGGFYAMIGRRDGENLYVLFSEDVESWPTAERILEPAFPWEFIQMGNCGSPIETEAGWLVLSHGVGPMRKYCMGGFLLDLADPRKVIGRMKTPFLEAEGSERDGYVPNVIYSCGSILHGRELILPFAISDSETHFATVPVDDLLASMS